MSAKLLVGNLSYSTTEETLQQVFSESGEVRESTVVRDRDTDRSRGFAHVTFASRPEAEAAISTLNGQEIDGRAITVEFANSGSRGGQGYHGGQGYGGGYSYHA